jgi:glutathione S-transferase
MDLYFSPLACSMATRIALYEAGQAANFIEVDPKTKKVLKDNSDYYAINPLGLVPVVRTDDGVILTENAAILQHVAERYAESAIGAKPGMERSKLQQWLCFIGTELHKSLFTPLLGKTTPPEVKAYTLEKYLSRLEYLDNALKGREYLLDRFTVADAYLTTVLNWSIAIWSR